MESLAYSEGPSGDGQSTVDEGTIHDLAARSCVREARTYMDNPDIQPKDFRGALDRCFVADRKDARLPGQDPTSNRLMHWQMTGADAIF